MCFFVFLPVRKTIPYNRGTFFITFTCKDWLPIIELCKGYDVVYQWFSILKANGHYINGYVIMPNHVHVLITFVDTGQQINSIVGNGKRFMAYTLVKRLKAFNYLKLLKRLHESVELTRKKNKKLHDIWENSFDWKHCASDYFIYQKLNYIHANPCKGKWMLSSNFEEYPYSSAFFYLTGIQGLFPVDNIELMKDV